jgi:hypothetical protein
MGQAASVAEQPTLSRVEPPRLLAILRDLCNEIGADTIDEQQSGGRAAQEFFGRNLSGQDGQLIVALRAGLERLARSATVDSAQADAAVRSALDGAEFVAGGDILLGRRARLAELLPSFVFLTLLPISGKAEALRLATRAAGLLAVSDA